MHWITIRSHLVDAAGVPHDMEVWLWYDFQVADHLPHWIKDPPPIYHEKRVFSR